MGGSGAAWAEPTPTRDSKPHVFESWAFCNSLCDVMSSQKTWKDSSSSQEANTNCRVTLRRVFFRRVNREFFPSCCSHESTIHWRRSASPATEIDGVVNNLISEALHSAVCGSICTKARPFPIITPPPLCPFMFHFFDRGAITILVLLHILCFRTKQRRV